MLCLSCFVLLCFHAHLFVDSLRSPIFDLFESVVLQNGFNVARFVGPVGSFKY